MINLDCWPSGRFCVGFIVPPAEQATIIFESFVSFESTPVLYMLKCKLNDMTHYMLKIRTRV